MEHLALEIFNLNGGGSQFAVLDDDTSITITDTSEVFASGDVWSFSFALNIPANARIFGSSGDMHGSYLHELIHKRRARLWVEGTPLYIGYLKLGDEVDVDDDGNVDVVFESGNKTFENLIEGGKANQVPMFGNVQIGVALWRKRWTWNGVRLNAMATFGSHEYHHVWQNPADITHTPGPIIGDGDDKVTIFINDGEDDETSVQEYPRMVFPRGEFMNMETGQVEYINRINTDTPYDDGHPYCNVALCYQKYGFKRKNERGEIVENYDEAPEAERGYEYMPANRVNSAPCFFVIYFIKSLMKHIGIHIEENQMTDVEDMRRLFLVNTKCAYKEPKHLRYQDADPTYQDIKKYQFAENRRYIAEQFDRFEKPWVQPGDDKFSLKSEDGDFSVDGPYIDWKSSFIDDPHPPVINRLTISASEVVQWSDAVLQAYLEHNCYLHDAYASSECFPDVDISEVIKALESGFGVRFLFSADYKRVRIVLLRNIFNSKEVQDIQCDIISETKTENNIKGFRMTYGNTEDTHFYYKGFADMLPHKKQLWIDDSDKHDYSQWELDSLYKDVLNRVTAFNKTCYVTPVNGNAYGVKVDQDAKRYDDLHPSLFEFAGFMDAEDGDCSGEEDTIETVNVNFTPAIMNDLNMDKERGKNPVYEQQFALFVNEKMAPRRPELSTDQNRPDYVYDIGRMYREHPEKVRSDGFMRPGEFGVISDLYTKTYDKLLHARIAATFSYDSMKISAFDAHWNIALNVKGYISDIYRLYLQDNFEPNDDGISPIEAHEWGLTLAIMRGSGSDAFVDYTVDPQDGEGNDTWDITPGINSIAHPDTCDSYGNEWNYDNELYIDTPEDAKNYMSTQWPNSNYNLVNHSGNDYLTRAGLVYLTDADGVRRNLLIAYPRSDSSDAGMYALSLVGKTVDEMYAIDAQSENRLIEVDSSAERRKTLLDLQKLAFNNGAPMYVSGGVSTLYSRFSLKLRAEKPNPKFDPKKSEDEQQEPRYLNIEKKSLRQRGLSDQFYKEYSHYVRNCRIAKMDVKMELAQLMSIDKTKKVRVGDVIGYIKKMQYSISNKTGLGIVKLEIMYI